MELLWKWRENVTFVYYLRRFCCLVTKSCLTLLGPHGLYSLPGSFVHGISQVRILERVPISLTRGLSDLGIELTSPALAGRFFTTEPLGKPFREVQFSPSVVSDSLRPHESQHARPPCPSPTPGVYSTHVHRVSDAIQPSHPLSSPSCPQSLPASESFPMSQLFAWGGQSTGVSALASVLSKNTQDWSPLERIGGSPCSPRDSQESSPTPQFKTINSSALSLLHNPTLTSIHDHRKDHSLD